MPYIAKSAQHLVFHLLGTEDVVLVLFLDSPTQAVTCDGRLFHNIVLQVAAPPRPTVPIRRLPTRHGHRTSAPPIS